MKKTHHFSGPHGPTAGQGPTLSDVSEALTARDDLSATRLRDLRSAVTRVAELLGEDPRVIRLDLPTISTRLATVNPIEQGLSPKRWSNIRSDFLAAVKASGLATIRVRKGSALRPAWAALFDGTPSRRVQIGLSRFARFASDAGVDPREVDDATMERFIAAVRENSLHQRPAALHRTVAAIWNELAGTPGVDLRSVTVPSIAKPGGRIDWNLLPASFREDVDAHLSWCRGSNPFDADARLRPLAAQTVKLRRSQIHTAVTALLESAVAPAEIASLADLVAPAAFKQILRRRMEVTGGRRSAFNRDLGAALVQIAREWVKVDAVVLAELKRLLSKMPAPATGLTDKNKRFLRQFDDPAVERRLLDLPGKLWAEVKRDDEPGFRKLAKAQAAIAIGLLPFIPLRAQNLTALTFDTHLFLRDRRQGISTLELPSDEVKNGMPMAFDIPPHVAKMLVEYRDRITPKILGHRPTKLFVNADGTTKCQEAVSDLITRVLRRRAGIVMTPHQFRHLSAKMLLDDSPGNFVTVSHLLGHKNLKTAVGFYGGVDSRRAGRHHQKLIERKLAERTLLTRHRRPKKDDQHPGDVT